MFRLIRLAILLLVAFVAGVVYERGQAQPRCDAQGGTWDSAGFCTNAGGSDG